MSLTDKLRELAELQTKLRSETCMGAPWADRDRAFRDACTLTNFAALLAEAERLEAQDARLWELVRSAYAEGYSDAALDEDGNSEDAMWTKSFTAKELDALDKEGSDDTR